VQPVALEALQISGVFTRHPVVRVVEKLTPLLPLQIMGLVEVVLAPCLEPAGMVARSPGTQLVP
jgi:hypothetical protein